MIKTGVTSVIHQGSCFPAPDRIFSAPGDSSVDRAIDFNLTAAVEWQPKIEACLGERYVANAHSTTTHISGSPRALRDGLHVPF